MPGGSLNCISLCTGGGGLDLGVELAIPSARAVCLVEREAFAVAHLVDAMRAGLLAPAALWSDVRTFRGRPWRGLVDGVFGGIPCQPHSLAGKRLGADDERDLWADARRIVVQSGAWWVLIENVEGMLTSGGGQRVWRDLGRLGFAREVGLFRASEIRASQGRPRVFILGVADGRHGRQPGGRQHDGRAIARCEARSDRHDADRRHPALAHSGGAGLPDPEQPGQPGQAERGLEPRSTAAELRRPPVVRAVGGERDGRAGQPGPGPAGRAPVGRPDEGPLFPPGPADLDAWRALLVGRPDLEPAVRRGADGLADRVDRLRMLGNGVVPLQAAYALRTLATRLAARSAGAAFLVSLMEDAAA
ncbi:MAG: DNA-cytosine methyltransferase [Phenylobacterium sp.]|nr:DNA-cytosine methyltransferase [Phenylobacterium sp.]